MPTPFFSTDTRLKAALALCLLAAGCGGGNGGGAPSGSATVAVSGTVTFDFVPVVPGGAVGSGLRHNETEARPARLVTVEFVSDGRVLAATTTSSNGGYALTLPSNTNGFLRVKAESVRTGTPSWHFRVVDNTNGNALWTLDGTTFSSGTANSTRNLHAASGWTGASYGNPRSAAPFAVLDAFYQGAEYVLAADSTLQMPPMTAHWSPSNTPTVGELDIAAGALPSSFFGFDPDNPAEPGMYLVGAAGVDTDEYDRHVILHELAHYLEWAFSRSDSIGGPHAFGDVLDMRLAFSEGFGNAFSALAQNDPIYRDSFVQSGRSVAGWFDLEGDVFDDAKLGWFSEQSVQEILYDIIDSDDDGADRLTLELGVLLDVLMDKFEGMSPLAALFPLVEGIVDLAPETAQAIELLLAEHEIAPVVDDYGSGEQNDAGAADPADVLPIYHEAFVGGPAVNVCSTDEFGEGATGVANKLGTRRFVRFTPPPGAAAVTIRATATEIPDGHYADPDFIIHRAGLALVSESEPSETCKAFGAGGWQPGDCFELAENIVLPDQNAEYILEVYEWTNAEHDLPDEFEPIGRTCFDVTVTQ